MPHVEVQLRPGFLARYVTLTAREVVDSAWEIQATDSNGTRFPVTVDGEPARVFASESAAQNFLTGLDSTQVWATGNRIPTSYVQHANDGRSFFIQATA